MNTTQHITDFSNVEFGIEMIINIIDYAIEQKRQTSRENWKEYLNKAQEKYTKPNFIQLIFRVNPKALTEEEIEKHWRETSDFKILNETIRDFKTLKAKLEMARHCGRNTIKLCEYDLRWLSTYWENYSKKKEQNNVR
jgi:hypothetical protein